MTGELGTYVGTLLLLVLDSYFINVGVCILLDIFIHSTFYLVIDGAPFTDRSGGVEVY